MGWQKGIESGVHKCMCSSKVCEANLWSVWMRDVSTHLRELYQGLANLPLMLHTSTEWAKLQICDDSIKMFYNDIHEYHCYMLLVPYIDATLLGQVSQIVDGGK